VVNALTRHAWLVLAAATLVATMLAPFALSLSDPAFRLVTLGGVVAAVVFGVFHFARGFLPRLAAMAIAIGVLPIVVLGVLNDRIARAALTGHGDALLRGAAERTARNVDVFLGHALENARTDARDPEFARLLSQHASSAVDPEELRTVREDLSAKAVRDAIFVSSIALIARDGVVLADTASSAGNHAEESCPILAEAIASGIVRVQIDRCGNEPTQRDLVVVAPVRGARGRVLGVLRIRYDLAVLQSLLASDTDLLGLGSLSTLIGEDGTVLAHSSDPRLVLASVRPWNAFDRFLAGEASIGSVETPASRDDVRPLRIAKATLRTLPWQVVFAQPPGVYLAPFDAQSRLQVDLALSILGLALVLAWFFARGFVKPMQRLRAAAERLSRGELDARVAMARDDEIGALASAFDRMADRLGESLVGLQTEVRERTRVEAELRASEERFRALVENAHDLILVVDAEGIIHFATPNSARLLEIQEAAVVGTRLLDRVAEGDHATVRRFLSDGEDDSPHPIAFELRAASGAVRVVEAVKRRAEDVPGIRGVIVTLRDVTDRRNLEVQLAQAQKMEGIGLLAGGIAHDFNNLLVPIFGHGELAREAMPEGHPARESLDRVLAAAQSAKRLVQQLLAFGRKQTLSIRGVDVRKVVEETASWLRRTLRDDIVLQLCCENDPVVVDADPTQVRQVLVNLMLNAEDAMPHGGSLEIVVKRASERETARGRGDPIDPQGYAVIEVRDTGQGMDADTQARLFEPFFTTKELGRGTGLGLATAYGIVRQHRGAIRFESAPGKGTAFRVFLPLSVSQAPAEGVARVEPTVHLGGTVLLVEDDLRVRDLVAQVLESNGYEVWVADSPERALQLAASRPTAIDLLLTDVVMPHMNGRALFERLREKRPRLHVLYMSGYAGDILARNGVIDDGTSFLAKPFTSSELLYRVATEIAAARGAEKRHPAAS
jgi:two-component system cell cycle sensor histidine kinase/response regulator CckA